MQRLRSDPERAETAARQKGEAMSRELTRENIEVMLKVAYKAGWRDGIANKELPTLKWLDDFASGIYDRATTEESDE